MSQKQLRPMQSRHSAKMVWQQAEAIFSALPGALLISDREGKICALNAAASELFAVQEESAWSGVPCREFLQRYEWWDEYDRPTFFAPWLLDLPARGGETTACLFEQTYRLHLSTQRTVLLEARCAPLLDTRKQVIGVLLAFQAIAPRYQRALHLQRIYEAISTLNEAIAQLPELPITFSDEMPLLLPPVLSVAQHLVDVIRQVIGCWRVSLLARDVQTKRMFYIVGSGFTPEQEQQRRALRGRFSITEMADASLLAPLDDNREVIIRADQLHLPAEHPADFGAARLLGLPLLLREQRVGVLVIAKQGWESSFTQEEIELARAVAAQAMLVIECLISLQEQAGEQAREMVQHELQRLSRDFLTLASHELRTPLTGIKGNLQLARRRLGMLQRHLADHPESISTHLEHAQQSLEQAEQSARLQERMVQDMIDDARIQANQLTLYLKPCDLLVLVNEAIAKQQVTVPEHEIKLEVLAPETELPVLADARRITQVLNIYLASALDASPPEKPVHVQVREEEGMARVSVHDEGPGIPLEEQGRLWERFYRGKGSAVQHELDLSLGLSFYLCQALIERHHGGVGVESVPDHGTTFWFTLPLA